MKRVLILAFILMSTTFLSKAQGNIGLHVGASFPVGDFASDNSDYGGGAATGLNVGVKYFIPLSSHKGLSLTLSADYLNNGMDQTSKDMVKEQTPSGVSDVVINYTDYINVPVFVGLNYKIPVTHSFALFADGALGLNYSAMTDMVINYKYLGTSARSTMTFTPLTRLAYQFGVGIMIDNNYTIGLHSNLLGTYSFKAKTIQESSGYSQTSDVPSTMNVKIDIVTLSVGIRF